MMFKKKRKQPPAIQQEMVFATPKANQKAYAQNIQTLKNRLERTRANILFGFVEANFDALEQTVPSKKRETLYNAMNALQAALDNKKPLPRAAVSTLRKAAVRFAKKTKIDFDEIDLTPLNLTPTTPEQAQEKIETTTKRNQASRQKLKRIPTHWGNGLKWIMDARKLPHHFLFGPAEASWDAVAKYKEWGPLKSTCILSSFAVPVLGAYLYAPMPAAPHADLLAGIKNNKEILHDVCHDPRVMAGSRLTLSFALANAPKTADQRLQFLASMTGLDYNIEPMGLNIISRVETANGLSVRNPISSAEGPYNTLDGTAIEMIAKYGKKTNSYKAAKGSQNPRDIELVAAIEQISTDYKNNPQKLIKDFKKSKIGLGNNTALLLARTPVVASEIESHEINARGAKLTVKDLRGQSLNDIVTEVADFYGTHLLGGSGNKFLDYVVAKAPQTNLTNKAQMRKLYVAMTGSKNEKTIKSMTTYLARMAGKQPGIFPNDGFANKGNITAQQYKGYINAYVQTWAAPLVKSMTPYYLSAKSNFELCVKDEAKAAQLAAIRKTTTNRAELAWMHLPKGTRTEIKSAAKASKDYMLSSIFSFASAAMGALAPAPSAQKPQMTPAERQAQQKALTALIKQNNAKL